MNATTTQSQPIPGRIMLLAKLLSLSPVIIALAAGGVVVLQSVETGIDTSNVATALASVVAILLAFIGIASRQVWKFITGTLRESIQEHTKVIGELRDVIKAQNENG